MEKLSPKEQLFCRYYLQTGNYREAAARSGYPKPEKTGLKLLSAKRISEAISKLKFPPTASSEVIGGLKRIAFGSISDAVALLFAEDLPADLDSLDLFCISEIKRPKGGGMEIKFFDRIKALEQLSVLTEKSAVDTAEPFYKALERSAQGLFSDGGGEDIGI